jgi:hypothetical protein
MTLTKKIKVLISCNNELVTKFVKKFKRYGTSLKDHYSADFDIIGELVKT